MREPTPSGDTHDRPSRPGELDEQTLEALLAGPVPADAPAAADAPPEAALLGRLLDMARVPARPFEQSGEDEARALFRAARATGPVAPAAADDPAASAPDRGALALVARHDAAVRRARRRRLRVAAVAGAATLALATGTAAAAGGHLPDGVQKLAQKTFAITGVSIPDGGASVPTTVAPPLVPSRRSGPAAAAGCGTGGPPCPPTVEPR